MNEKDRKRVIEINQRWKRLLTQIQKAEAEMQKLQEEKLKIIDPEGYLDITI